MKQETKFKKTEIGEIPEDWNVKSVKDLTIKVTKGTTPTTLKKQFVDEGINFIKVESITESGEFIPSKFAFIDEETNQLLKRSIIEPEDVLFSIAGVIGRTAIVTTEVLPANTNQALAIVRPNKSIVSPLFLRYALANKTFTNKALSNVVQTAQPNLSLGLLLDGLLGVPEIVEQKIISKILSDLDSKIEVLQHQNKTLEEIGKAIFKQWFVDFEFPNEEGKPYKSSGRGMVESELGEIPKGWNYCSMIDIIYELVSGNRPKGGITDIDKGIPSIGAENIIGLGKYKYNSNKLIPESFFNKMKKGIVKNKDVLLYKDGAQLGRKSMFGCGFPFKNCCINEHVFIIRCNEKICQEYLFFWLDQSWMTNEIVNLNANSAQPGINKESVNTLPMLIPDKDTIIQFQNLTKKLIEKIFRNSLCINELSKTRNLLLPKLMSGKIRVMSQ